MAAASGDLVEALKPFHERASEAEKVKMIHTRLLKKEKWDEHICLLLLSLQDRLTKLESILNSKQDSKNDELLNMVSDLQSNLEDVQTAQASEKKKASVETEKLRAENEKLKYRIAHLVRALKECGSNLAQ